MRVTVTTAKIHAQPTQISVDQQDRARPKDHANRNCWNNSSDSMSARYRTISGLLGFVDPIGGESASRVEIEVIPEPADAGPSRKSRKRDSLRKISVRHLVNKLETRATESLERNFGGRFSGRLRRGKLEDEPAAAAAAAEARVVAEEPPKIPSDTSPATGQRTWYMVHLSPGSSRGTRGAPAVSHGPSADQHDDQLAVIEHDKISADSAEFRQRALDEKAVHGCEMKPPSTPSIDREDSGRWSICSDFEKDSLPDVDDVCDTWNEFIYLRLSDEKAKHLNSYSPDFETSPFDEFYLPAEASNTIISLRFTPHELHRIIYGHELSDDEHDAASQSSDESESDSVFLSATDHSHKEQPDPVLDSLDEGVVFRESPVASPEPPYQSDIDINISFLIDELLETERNYINTLEKGIATYVEGVFNERTPPELNGKKYHLFGNLEYIYRFHQNAFLPKLLTAGKDVERIADAFVQFLENDSFYGYILYSMYHPKSQRLCEQHIGFFREHQQQHADKLGVKSLILQPIQRLPRYQLLLSSLFKQLVKKPGGIGRNTQLHKVCVAEKRLQTLIGIMNESVTINDILQCEKAEDDEVELGFGVPKPAIVLKNQNHDNQVLFLYPKDNENVDRNKPINILHQGKFRSVFPVFINDLRLKRQFQGRLFVFERCVVYTEQLDTKCQTYRGHYSHQEIEFDFTNRQILKLSSRRHERLEIEVKINIQCPGKTHLPDIMLAIKTIIDRRDQRESFAIDGGDVLTGLRESFSCRTASVRSSFSSTISDSSFHSVFSHPASSAPPEDDPSTVSTRTHSVISDCNSIETMLHLQQHFERALEDCTNLYIRSLPEDVAGQLEEMVEILDEMLRIQHAMNYRLFEDNVKRLTFDSDVEYFCSVLRDCFRRSEFDVFLRYVEHTKTVESILMSFEQYYNGQAKPPGAATLPIDAFLYLPVKYINRCCQFFSVLWAQREDNREECAGLSGTDLRYVHEQISLVQRRVNENYQIRQLIMDVEFLNEIGLVKHSEIVKLEGSYALFRLLLTKTGLLCMKICVEKHKIETYNSVTFYCPYTKISARSSKRQGTLWYVYLDNRKTTLIFPSRQLRHLTIEHFNTLSTQMKQKERVKKRSFFYVP